MKYLKFVLMLLPFLTACSEKDIIEESANDVQWWFDFELSARNLSFSKQGGTQTIKVFNSDECTLGPVQKFNSKDVCVGYQVATLTEPELVLDVFFASFNSRDSTITIKLLPIDNDSITWKLTCYQGPSLGAIITVEQN